MTNTGIDDGSLEHRVWLRPRREMEPLEAVAARVVAGRAIADHGDTPAARADARHVLEVLGYIDYQSGGGLRDMHGHRRDAATKALLPDAERCESRMSRTERNERHLRTYRCRLAAGHTGRHRSRGVGWEDDATHVHERTT